MTSPSSPSSSCASIRSSMAASRRSSSCAASDRSDGSVARSPKAGPRHRSSAWSKASTAAFASMGRSRRASRRSDRKRIGIELRWFGPEQVARPASLEPLGAQRLAQVRGVALQGVPNGLGRLLTPYLIDQHVGRYQVVGAKEQVGEDRSLLGPPERDRAATVLDDLDRAQDPELHRATVAPGRRDGNAGCRRRAFAHGDSVGGVAESSLKGSGQRVTRLPHRAFMHPVRPCAHAHDRSARRLRSSL